MRYIHRPDDRQARATVADVLQAAFAIDEESSMRSIGALLIKNRAEARS